MVKRSDLVKLLQEYIDDSDQAIESDGFLEGLDVTYKGLVEALNDIITYHEAAGRIEQDEGQTRVFGIEYNED